jgi:two-component system LytT family sensor kinase
MTRVRVWAAVLVCWTLLALLFASQSLLYYAYAGNRVNSWRVIAPALADWYLWAALTPAIAWLARRAPIVSGGWRRALLVHVPASIAFALLKLELRVLIGHLWAPLATTTLRNLMMAQLHLNLVTYWVIAGLAHAVDYYRKYQEREVRASHLEASLARAQLEVLRMQLHPHFLFNTLNAISTLVRKDPDAAERTIAQLSDLLRMTLERLGDETSTVKDELEFVDRYLALQQTRFGDRLVVRQHVASDALDALVPSQILQPLVENAIRHGIAPRASGGRVDIDVRRADGHVTLAVRDDGPGLPGGGVGGPGGAGSPGNADAVKAGVGVTNTRARLAEMYGHGDYLRLFNHPDGGCVAEVRIPV